MRAASEIRWTISSLVLVLILFAFGVIALIIRMTPGVDRMLAEDVASLTAIDGMYAVLSEGECGDDLQVLDERFAGALTLARGSAHTPGEAELLDRIDSNWKLARTGDCAARSELAAGLNQLADINRQAIEDADRRVYELGVSGAWATALLGIGAFGVGAVLVRRFSKRMAEPMEEVEAVLAAVMRGDPYRRCRRLEAPSEYIQISTRLNQFLDRRLSHEEEEDPQLANIDRTLLHHLLDRLPHPVVAVDTSGAIIAASDGALDLLAGRDLSTLSGALESEDGGDATGLIDHVEPFGRADGFLIFMVGAQQVPEVGEEESAIRPRTATPSPAPARLPPNPLADRGGADDASSARPVEPSPPDDGREDWERD
jgi:hypothetical protein